MSTAPTLKGCGGAARGGSLGAGAASAMDGGGPAGPVAAGAVAAWDFGGGEVS